MKTLVASVRVLLGGVLLFATSSLAPATVVNVDFGQAGQTVYGFEGAYVTGDVHFWNNGSRTTSPETYSNLTASDGTTATTWDVTVTTHSATTSGVAQVAANSLLGDFIYSFTSINATSGRLTLNGLTPNAPYQVYLYNSLSNESMRYVMGTASDFSGGTLQAVSGRPSTTNPSDVTGANPVYTQGTDYVFYNLTSDGSGNIYGLFLGINDNAGGHLSGLQIIEVPEPSSVITMVLGSIGLFAGMRRRRR